MASSFAVLCLILLISVTSAAVDPTRDSCSPGATPPSTRTDTAERVRQLRTKMEAEGVDALIIPTADDHQNEYVGASDEKRNFITGFTGSAGTALVTRDEQLLWTDGRYFLQAADQLDCQWFLMRSGQPNVPSLTKWIEDNMVAAAVVAADPKVLSTKSWKAYDEIFSNKGFSLNKTRDLVGEVWNDIGGRPAPSNNDVIPLGQEFAGRTWQQKVTDLRNKMSEAGADALVVSALDEVAWLFNLRGSDIAYNPVFFAYAIVEVDSSKSPTLYLRDSSTRLNSANLTQHLGCDNTGECTSSYCTKISTYTAVDDGVKYYNDAQRADKTIWISDSTNYYISSLINNKKQIKKDPSPLLLMKAIKNPTERQGMRMSHIRDSAVIVQFISKLERELDEGKDWDELKVVSGIDGLRGEQKYNRGLSFSTIAGSGKNGAYIHYHPTAATNNAVNKNNMLLLDSGGQYLDGTTDITRTFHFGTPTDFQKLAYTLVLLGVIDLAMVKFPANKTLGSSLDTLARRPLWQYGLDFGHGTGHGIGMFLNVHEGPAGIAGRRASSSVSNERPVYDGMFFSDEPGYYDDKREFGVRLETIVMATYVDTQYGAANSTLGFEVIALVPFETKLIKLDMLDDKQRTWLNDYHKLCLEKTGEHLKEAGHMEAYDWLKNRTSRVPMTQKTSYISAGTQNTVGALFIITSALISYATPFLY